MAAASGDATAMSAQDMEICRQTINLLLSAKYKDKSYLFRDPFDLTQVGTGEFAELDQSHR